MNSELLERMKEVQKIIEFECVWGGVLYITFALYKSDLKLKVW